MCSQEGIPVNGLSYSSTAGWEGCKTMEHPSGIWGRTPTIRYLRSKIDRGNTVVDLGSGCGYPTSLLAEMVGGTGNVVGIEKSTAMLEQARADYKIKNLNFKEGDVSDRIPLPNNYADVVTSFMVCHTMPLGEVRSMFRETARILRRGGTACMLTMHPEALDSYWDLDFMVYDPVALETYRQAKDKEGIRVPGRVKNSGGGEKEVEMINHTRINIYNAIEDAGLKFFREHALMIDEATAIEKFGSGSVRKLPATSTFWRLVFEKK